MVQERLSGPGPRARTPAARAACRGRAGSLRGPRPGSEVQKLGGAGRGSAASPPPPRAASRARPREPRKSGAGAGEAGSPDRRSARSGLSSVLPPLPGAPGPRASVRAASLPWSARPRVQVHVPPLRSRPCRLALVSPRSGRRTVPEAAAGGGSGVPGPFRACGAGFPPGRAGSFCFPGPPRRASALLGAPAAWRLLGARFGLHDSAASPGCPFQTL